MIIRPGRLATIPDYGTGFGIKASASILTTTRKYDEYWVDPLDLTKHYGPFVWGPIMLPVNGISAFGGTVTLPTTPSQSWTGTSTFKLLNEAGATLWQMVSTVAFDITYDVSAYPPGVLVSSHGSLSNAYPDGLSYTGYVNGYSVDTLWTPADAATYQSTRGTFETFPILGCIPRE